MNQKIEITKYVADQLNINREGDRLQKLVQTWWKNPRSKEKNGFGLTEKGFECLTLAGIKSYKIKFEKPPLHTGQFVVWTDNLITCPFYINHKEIHVFDEKVAVQLALFSGNVHKFMAAKAKKI